MRNKIKRVSKSKQLFLLGNSFIAGIFFGPSSILLGFFFLFVFFFLLYPLYNRLVLVWCVLFFIVGAYYFNSTIYNIPEKIETPFVGVVNDVPVERGSFKRVVVRHKQGKALLYVDRYDKYKYGDVLRVDGRFSIPEEEGYRNYLRKEGVSHVAFYPQIEKIDEDGFFLYRFLYNLKEKAQQNIRSSLPAPQVFLLEAMILGDRTSFSDELNEKLSISGTRHITAISGMHIVIISGILFYFFLFLKIKKRKAALFSIILIALFVIFVGAPASAIRAGFMGSALLLSHIFYEKTHSFRLISFVAALMLLFNPLLLHYDLGFQLSFLAVIGILTFHQRVKSFLIEKKNRISIFLKRNESAADILAVTIAAQIMVTPLVLHNFGHLSLYAVPANLLIIPLLPLIMPFGMLTAVTGSIVFSFFAYVFLGYILRVVDFFSSLPFSAIYIEDFSLTFLILFYTLIFLFLYWKQRKKELFDI